MGRRRSQSSEVELYLNRLNNLTPDYYEKTALITGATSGIGEACARKFAEGGYNLILTARRKEKLAEIKAQLEAEGTKVRTLVFDVRDAEAAKQAIASLEPEWQTIDVLINNAGLALGLEKEYEGDPEDWNTMIDTNIKGLLTMTRLIVPAMVERNEGHVINIGSVAGDAAYAGGNVYCATKAAVKTITDGLRIDVAESAVRVTNVNPDSLRPTSATCVSTAITPVPRTYTKASSRSPEPTLPM